MIWNIWTLNVQTKAWNGIQILVVDYRMEGTHVDNQTLQVLNLQTDFRIVRHGCQIFQVAQRDI